jgi:RNA polymerase sigma-70 factor (ECF subfamily)
MRFPNQRALIKALRRQNPRALEDAIDLYGGYVLAVVKHTLGKTGTREDAEELVSDVFVTLWRKADSLDLDSHLKPWLAVVARNTSLNRRRSFVPMRELDDQTIQAADATTAATFIDDARDQPVGAALEALKPVDSELLRRHYFEEQDIATIAKGTGLSESAVTSRLYRGRWNLRNKLERQGGEV